MAYTLEKFAVALNVTAMRLHSYRLLDKGAHLLEEEVKAMFGVYQEGWPPLSETVIARHGDTPLLETGETRDSVRTVTDREEAYVGTDSKKMLWAEFGTSRGEPPRPVFGIAAIRGAPRVVAQVQSEVVALMEVMR